MERGCGMVAIAGGTFTMGEEAPAHRATPLQPGMTVGSFVLDAYEVTVARFRRFWSAGHPAPAGPIVYPGGSIAWAGSVVTPITGATDNNWSASAGSLELHPINAVTWWTSQAFCVWDGGRLPTEAEWEYAARGRTTGGLTAPRVYPWGNADPSMDCDRAQWNRCPGDDGGSTRRVGSFAAADRIYDQAGNVWEYLADNMAEYSDVGCWNGTHLTNPICNTGPTGDRVFRGAAWRYADVTGLRSASRNFDTPTGGSSLVGFRCARTR
jgi:formylglycine-generating enzyme required for sulfatase activity